MTPDGSKPCACLLAWVGLACCGLAPIRKEWLCIAGGERGRQPGHQVRGGIPEQHQAGPQEHQVQGHWRQDGCAQERWRGPQLPQALDVWVLHGHAGVPCNANRGVQLAGFLAGSLLQNSAQTGFQDLTTSPLHCLCRPTPASPRLRASLWSWAPGSSASSACECFSGHSLAINWVHDV